MGRILVVERNSDSQEHLGHVLQDAGHEVALTGDRESAIAMTRTGWPEFVVIDIMLPGMNGMVAIDALKADPSTRAIPIIAISTGGYLDQLREQIHADALLNAPFDGEALVADVARQLSQSVRNGDVWRFLAYDLDRLTRDPQHLFILLDETARHDCALEFVRLEFDASPEGWLMQYVLGYVAQKERAQIKERTMRGKKARAEAGKPLPGSRCL